MSRLGSAAFYLSSQGKGEECIRDYDFFLAGLVISFLFLFWDLSFGELAKIVRIVFRVHCNVLIGSYL